MPSITAIKVSSRLVADWAGTCEVCKSEPAKKEVSGGGRTKLTCANCEPEATKSLAFAANRKR